MYILYYKQRIIKIAKIKNHYKTVTFNLINPVDTTFQVWYKLIVKSNQKEEGTIIVPSGFMFCNQCGKQLPDGTKFCSGCGANLQQAPEITPQEAPVVEAPAVETPVVETPVVEVPVAETPAVETAAPAAEAEQTSEVNWDSEQPADYFQFAGMTEEPQAPKKKKKWWKVAVFTLVPLALVAAIVAMNFTLVAGYAIKWFGSDSAYLKYVEANSISGYADNITDIYDIFTGNDSDIKYSDIRSGQSEVKVVIGDKVKTLLSQAGVDVDLSWLNGVVFKTNANINEDLMSAVAAIEIDGQQIFSYDQIVDLVNMQIFARIKELNEKYIGINATNTYSGSSASVENLIPTAAAESVDVQERMEMYSKIIEALPDGDTVDSLIKRYIKTALGAVDTAEAETKTVKLNGVYQDLTCIELDVTTGVLIDVAYDVLDELENDGDIEDIIDDFSRAAAGIFMAQGVDMDDVYSQFREVIKQAKTTIKSSKSMMTKEDDEVVFSIKDYVNSKHEIVGRTLTVGEQEVLTYITVRDGKNFAFEAEVQNLVITGEGTEESDKVNATYTVKVGENDIVDIKLVDFDAGEFEDGNLVGTVRIIPSQAVLTQALGSNASMLGILDPAFEFKFNLNEEGGSQSINILSGEEVLIGFDVTITLSEDEQDITVPSGDDVIMIEDEDDFRTWAESIDLQKIIDNLKKTDIPAEYTDLLEGILDRASAY